MYILLVMEKGFRYYDVLFESESMEAISNKIKEIHDNKNLSRKYKKYKIAFMDLENPVFDSDIEEGEF